jgi:phosphopentomutase
VLQDNGFEVRAVGKIEDIFNASGITSAVHIHGNMDGVNRTLEWMEEDFEGLLFTNWWILTCCTGTATTRRVCKSAYGV